MLAYYFSLNILQKWVRPRWDLWGMGLFYSQQTFENKPKDKELAAQFAALVFSQQHRVWLAQQQPSEMENYDRRYWQWKAAAKLVIQKQRLSLGCQRNLSGALSANMKSALSFLSAWRSLDWLITARSSREDLRRQPTRANAPSASTWHFLTNRRAPPAHFRSLRPQRGSLLSSPPLNPLAARADDFSSLFFAPCHRPQGTDAQKSLQESFSRRCRMMGCVVAWSQKMSHLRKTQFRNSNTIRFENI